jgi:X-X-X-Leu-X-X-Gly heptad repeat protein
MDSASELADGIADLADGVAELADSVAELADGVAELADCVAELADGVITKHGTALHGTRLPRTTRFRKKMQLSAKLGYIHCDAKDVIAGVRCSRESRGSRGSTLCAGREHLWAFLLPVKS